MCFSEVAGGPRYWIQMYIWNTFILYFYQKLLLGHDWSTSSLIHHPRDHIDRNWEYNCAVVFCWYTVQSLKIPQLQEKILFEDDIQRLIFFTCRAAGLSIMISAACLRALLALCSPSAAITLALASLAASASAAMALCNCSGTLTSSGLELS